MAPGSSDEKASNVLAFLQSGGIDLLVKTSCRFNVPLIVGFWESRLSKSPVERRNPTLT